MTRQPRHGAGRDIVARLQKKALLHLGRGQYHESEVCLGAALRTLKSAQAFPSRDHLSLWNQRGMVCKYLGRLKRARQYYRLALRYAPTCLTGRDRISFVADIFHNLGGLEHSRRRFRQGEKYARKGLELRRELGRSGQAALASDMVALAAILDGLRKFSESEMLYHRALRIYHRELGRNHPETAVLLNNLAALFQATERPSRAEAHYLSSLRIKRRVLAPSHPDVAVTMNNLATLYRSQGKQPAASVLFRSALEILSASLGNRHPATRAVRANYRKSIAVLQKSTSSHHCRGTALTGPLNT
ncbi:MAG: tetratricopeptide repeat protein [Candidatus Acidiferrum sp.]